MNLEYLLSLYFHPKKGSDKATTLNVEMAPVYLNLAYQEVFLAHSWIYRKRDGQITLEPRYTTGTVSVTKYARTNLAASRTITFTGASLTTNMVGHFIKFQDGDKWYRIDYLTGSGTAWTGYLDSPVTDVDSGSKTFEIWKRYYNLKSDVADFLDFGRWSNGHLEYDPDLIGKYDDVSKEAATPTAFNVVGSDKFADITSTGTIDIAKDSNVGTVADLNLLSSGYDTGDAVEIGDVDYYINRIESNTRLVFFNHFATAKDDEEATFKKNNSVTFEFYNPPDNYYSLPYTYLGRAYDLVHKTKDMILLPKNFIPAIISRAHYYDYKASGNEDYVNMLNVYTAELEGLKAKVQMVKARYTKFSPRILSTAPGRG